VRAGDLFGGGNRVGIALGDLVGQLESDVHRSICVGGQFLNKADSMRAAGVERISGEKKPQGFSSGDHPGEAMDSDSCDGSNASRFGESEPGVHGGHPKIAAQRQLESPAEGPSVNNGNDGLTGSVEPDEMPEPRRSLELTGSLGVTYRFLDVGTSGEGSPGAPQDPYPETGITVEPVDGVDQSVTQCLVLRIQRLGSVEGDDQGCSSCLELDRFVAHC